MRFWTRLNVVRIHRGRTVLYTKIEMVNDITRHYPSKDVRKSIPCAKNTYLTGPSLSMVDFVSSVSGVEAMTQTFPFDNLIAVERPPKGIIPKRAKGLQDWVARLSTSSWLSAFLPRKRPHVRGHLANKKRNEEDVDLLREWRGLKDSWTWRFRLRWVVMHTASWY